MTSEKSGDKLSQMRAEFEADGDTLRDAMAALKLADRKPAPTPHSDDAWRVGKVVNSQGATGCLEVDCDNTPATCKAGCGRHKRLTAKTPRLVWDDMTKTAYAMDNTRIVHGAEFVLASDSALGKQEGGSHYKGLVIQPVEYIYRNGLGYLEVEHGTEPASVLRSRY